MLDNEKFKALIGISENYEMPEKLMKILENQEDRERIFTILADQETDMSYDWFTDVYQQEHGDRDALKQDFTPRCLTECLAGLVGANGSQACGHLRRNWRADDCGMEQEPGSVLLL